jgi:uncharacterized membrane protein YozB (DUF420 family)
MYCATAGAKRRNREARRNLMLGAFVEASLFAVLVYNCQVIPPLESSELH